MKSRLQILVFLLMLSLTSRAQIGGDYDPTSPSDPGTPELKYQLTLTADPVNGGSFNISSERLSEGAKITLQAYPNTDHVFKQWITDGEVLSTETSMEFVMPAHSVNIVGVFEYSPANPANPSSNFWNPRTGELVVDDFTPGRLSDVINSLLNGSSRDAVTKISVFGVMSSGDFGILSNFKNCRIIDLSNVTGVTGVPSNTFSNTNCESVLLPATIEVIGNSAFSGCSLLSSFTMPESLTTIGDHAFYGCAALTAIDLPAGIISIGNGAFSGCEGIATVNYDATDPVGTTDIFNAAVYENATLNMPNAFMSHIKAVFPWNKFVHVVAKEGSALSAEDEIVYQGLTYVVIDPVAGTCATKPGENGTGTAGNTYEGDLNIPATITDGFEECSVIGIGAYGFQGNQGITSVSLPESLQSIGESAFSGCDAIVSVSYAAAHPVEADGSILSAAVYENAVLNMPNATLADIRSTTPWDRFSHIVAQDGTFGISLIAGQEFTYQGISYIVVDPATRSCKTKEGTDGSPGNVFEGELTIPPTVSDDTDEYRVVGIGKNGFVNCSGITSISLPNTLTSIEEYAFHGCDAIVSVNYAAHQPVESPDNVFSEATYTNAMLNMPNAILANVRATVPWNRFRYIVAQDATLTPGLDAGEDFICRGITYTVVDPDGKTCRTKDGETGNPGNVSAGDLTIPQTVTDGEHDYTVAGIGRYGFYGCQNLNSVSLPASIGEIGEEAFANCPRLTSLVWNAGTVMPEGVIEAIANPNLLVFVTDGQYAPAGMNDNVVVADIESGKAECRSLVLEQGFPFGTVRPFDAMHCALTKEFTQLTPSGGCAGWETILLPFAATSVAVHDFRGELTPFTLVTDIMTQYPYWLYEADSEGEWKEADGIKAGVPYLISMPNSEEYALHYRINGPVTFSNSGRVTITPETTAPYSVTWTSGHQFRPLWLPLDAEEENSAMGLNVGMEGLTDDEGNPLAPGSAFHIDRKPRPLEAYVTRAGARRALPVKGGQSYLAILEADNAISVTVESGTIYVSSPADRRIDIFRTDGTCAGTFGIKANEPLKVRGMSKGIYIIAGKKVII